MSGFTLKAKDGTLLSVAAEWVRFGRADDNDLVVRDPTISRYHINFYVKDGELIAEDAGSQNGFLVNGRPAAGAITLNHGDRLTVGASEFKIAKDGVLEPSPSTYKAKVDSVPIYASTSGDAPADGSKRRQVYLIAAVVVLFAIVLSKDDKKKVPVESPAPLTALPSDGYKIDTYRKKSLSEIESQAKFHVAKRDFDNGNYSRALNGFKDALTLNPENDEARDYTSQSEARLKSEIDDILAQSLKYMETLQYGRAKALAAQILTILSEQVPGYAKLIAQRNANVGEGRAPASQEESLLDLPCERTAPHEKICGQALEIIKISRKRLGEEDQYR